MSKWYLKQGNHISGPFSKQVLLKRNIVGRLSAQDQVSKDQKKWKFISSVPDLIPHYSVEEKLRAKQYLDERTGFERRQDQQQNGRYPRGEDRRNKERPDAILRRQLRTTIHRRFEPAQPKKMWPLTIIFFVLVSSFYLAYLFPKYLPVATANCDQIASQKVNWSNCIKKSINLSQQNLNGAQLRNSQLPKSNLMNTSLIAADLAYADLSFSNLNYSQLTNSNLIGANLKHTDLANADLSNADLSFADLTAANLGGAVLTGVKFDNAIWFDGNTCRKGSVGKCIISVPD